MRLAISAHDIGNRSNSHLLRQTSDAYRCRPRQDWVGRVWRRTSGRRRREVPGRQRGYCEGISSRLSFPRSQHKSPRRVARLHPHAGCPLEVLFARSCKAIVKLHIKSRHIDIIILGMIWTSHYPESFSTSPQREMGNPNSFSSISPRFFSPSIMFA